MSCTLNKLTSYNVGRVVHDKSTDTTTAQLVNPPSSCPDNVFVSKKAEIKIVEGANPELIFSMAKNKPVIIVPRAEYVEQVGSSGFGFGTFLICAALLLAAIGIVFAIRRRQEEDGTLMAMAGNPTPIRPSSGGGYASRSLGTTPRLNSNPAVATAPVQSGPTVINNNSGNSGLVEGMLIGSMLSNNHSERIIERERVIEREVPSQNFSSDNDDSQGGSGGSYSSDDDSRSSSYSSDSDSSSYSSDSSSSYSSDSGSSDSGGSFSSDS